MENEQSIGPISMIDPDIVLDYASRAYAYNGKLL